MEKQMTKEEIQRMVSAKIAISQYAITTRISLWLLQKNTPKSVILEFFEEFVEPANVHAQKALDLWQEIAPTWEVILKQEEDHSEGFFVFSDEFARITGIFPNEAKYTWKDASKNENERIYESEEFRLENTIDDLRWILSKKI